MADNLQVAMEFQDTYQVLFDNTACAAGNNTDHDFVGIQGMKDALRNMTGSRNGNLTKFKVWAEAGTWEQFGHSCNHYDWWMFPIDRKISQGLKYSVY